MIWQENSEIRRHERSVREGDVPLPPGDVGERQGGHQQPRRGTDAGGRVPERQPRRPLPQVSDKTVNKTVDKTVNKTVDKTLKEVSAQSIRVDLYIPQVSLTRQKVVGWQDKTRQATGGGC